MKSPFIILPILVMAALSACSGSSSDPAPLVVDTKPAPHTLVPKPMSYDERPGSLIVGPVMRVGAAGGAAEAREILLAGLAADGWRAEADPRQGHLMLAVHPESTDRFGEEGYLLEVGEKRAAAATAAAAADPGPPPKVARQ